MEPPQFLAYKGLLLLLFALRVVVFNPIEGMATKSSDFPSVVFYFVAFLVFLFGAVLVQLSLWMLDNPINRSGRGRGLGLLQRSLFPFPSPQAEEYYLTMDLPLPLAHEGLFLLLFALGAVVFNPVAGASSPFLSVAFYLGVFVVFLAGVALIILSVWILDDAVNRSSGLLHRAVVRASLAPLLLTVSLWALGAMASYL